jgi:hypothetical protein
VVYLPNIQQRDVDSVDRDIDDVLSRLGSATAPDQRETLLRELLDLLIEADRIIPKER